MDRVELKDKRKEREKHFLNPDGTITAFIYDKNIHFLHDGKYEDIDNTLVDHGDYYENLANDFHAVFSKKTKDLVNVKKGSYYLKFFLDKEELLDIDKCDEEICYHDLKEEIDFSYKLDTSRLKESIILRCKEKTPEYIDFKVDTNLSLELKQNKKIVAKDKEEIIFTIEAPYMYDAAGNYNYCIYYEIVNSNVIRLHLDTEWLKDKNTPYPVVIDPTIINGQGENVYDTFISSATPDNVRGVYSSMLFVGAEEDAVNRMLLKFVLPTISTGSNIINATGYLSAYETCAYIYQMEKPITVHAVTQNWDEETATWNNMHDKYEEYVQTYFTAVRNEVPTTTDPAVTSFDLTNIVKEWYSTRENYGIMLKWADETYSSDYTPYFCFSKYYDAMNETAFRPYMTITYITQNGIEQYMDYTNIPYAMGASYINNFNGNIVNEFVINSTVGAKISAVLKAVYNTNDVLNGSFATFAKGWNFNYNQCIYTDSVGEVSCLKYIDENNTEHYFYENSTGTFIDEEGLGLTITSEGGEYVLADSSSNVMHFKLIGDKYQLYKIKNELNEELLIEYTNNVITKIIDSEANEMIIAYNDNSITVTTSVDTATINIENGLLNSITNKYGTMNITYNANNLIDKISDISGLYFTYEYYSNSPYKVKSVKKYSSNNTAGAYQDFAYKNNATVISDGISKIIYSFSNKGNLISVKTFMGTDDTLANAYAYNQNYVNDELSGVNSSSVSSHDLPIKYVNNVLTNTSFEKTGEEISIGERCEGIANTGKYCFKMQNRGYLEYSLSHIEKNKEYTFSGYFKNTHPVTVKFYLTGALGTELLNEFIVPANEEFERYSCTFYFPNTYSTLGIDMSSDEQATNYLDDIQLESGIVANSYNMVENSDFSNGLNDWSISGYNSLNGNPLTNFYELITLPTEEKALKMKLGPEQTQNLYKSYDFSGKVGDVYHVMFWYKNEGVMENDYGTLGSLVTLQFVNVDELMGSGTFKIHLDNHSTEWQFFSGSFVADCDYSSFGMSIISQWDVNNLYITNVMLIKDYGSYSFDYDENGNIIYSTDLTGNEIQASYDNNNNIISKTFNDKISYKYEYDNSYPNRLLNGISTSGIATKAIYDENGNVKKTLLLNCSSKLIENGFYLIRQKGTNLYFDNNYINSTVELKQNECNVSSYELIKVNETYYRLKSGGHFLCASQNSIFLSRLENDNSLFEIVINDNASISLCPKEFSDKYVTVSNSTFAVTDKGENLNNQQFYLENISNKEYIENIIEYAENSNYVSKKIDSLGKEIIYETNDQGKVVKEIAANGNEKQYEYDKNLITGFTHGDKSLIYSYNSNNNISSVNSGNDLYEFTYTDFQSLENIKVNGNILVTKNYNDVNNTLIKLIFGNGQEITYEYDAFDRTTSVNKNGKKYNLYYDNFGNLAKVASMSEVYDFYYDFDQRLVKYVYNNYEFYINYNYNKYNIESKTYHFSNLDARTYEYEYNDDNLPIEFRFDNNIAKINYDSLGRVESKVINDTFTQSVKFYSLGNKTSYTAKMLKIGDNTYEYSYDDIYNIKEIKLNNELIKNFKYDSINQLAEENDYKHNLNIKYTYDINGNILFERFYDLTDGTFKCQNTYEYTNDWKDQLTKCNDMQITYDSVGNPLSLGSATLSWIDGMILSSYTDDANNLAVNYTYDRNGIRLSKTVNNVKTNYYIEDKAIVRQITNNEIIDFIRDENDNLMAFRYNGVYYFYELDALGNISGIFDSSFNLLAKYEYDSWGNHIGIYNPDGSLITDINHIAYKNPYRYKGYYYDSETDLYYLNNRYYSPKLKRFINIDSQFCDDILGYNLYLYCGNNPVCRTDSMGMGFLVTLATCLISAAVTVTAQVVSNIIDGNDETKWNDGLFTATVVGFCAGFGPKVANVISGLEPLISEVIQYTPYSFLDNKEQKTFNKKNLIQSSVSIAEGVALNWVGEKILKNGSYHYVNKGWFRPKRITSSINSTYAKKYYKGHIINSILSETSSVAYNTFKIAATTYPNMEYQDSDLSICRPEIDYRYGNKPTIQPVIYN